MTNPLIKLSTTVYLLIRMTLNIIDINYKFNIISKSAIVLLLQSGWWKVATGINVFFFCEATGRQLVIIWQLWLFYELKLYVCKNQVLNSDKNRSLVLAIFCLPNYSSICVQFIIRKRYFSPCSVSLLFSIITLSN